MMNSTRLLITKRSAIAGLASSVAILSLGAPFCASLAKERPPVYLDRTATPEARATDLVARLTLEEKSEQMFNTQLAIPRLKVPAYQWWNEALHGAGNSRPVRATSFPDPLGLAASFDPAGVQAMGKVIGREQRALFALAGQAGYPEAIGAGLNVWAPNINILRDPRWGRATETYGEDPYLTGQMAKAYVTGVQGPDAKNPVIIATPKHLAVYSGPEPDRHYADRVVTAHDLEDTFLPGFRTAVVEGKAGSVMCEYSRLNGVAGCANGALLNTKLRRDWGFGGLVVSDCNAVTDMVSGHKTAPTAAAAGAASVANGLDIECENWTDYLGRTSTQVNKYADAVKAGLLSSEALDRALVRSFTARYRLGAMDPVAAGRDPNAALRKPDALALAQRLADRSLVLLQNDGTLPLASSVRHILIAGPLAQAGDAMNGNYAGQSARYVTPAEGIAAAFPGAKIAIAPYGSSPANLSTVPTEVLTTPDGKPGLRVERFEIDSFADTGAKFTREAVRANPIRALISPIKLVSAPFESGVDPFIDFDSNTPGDYRVYGARWTAMLTPRTSGKYRLNLRGVTGRLTIDGQLCSDLTSIPIPTAFGIGAGCERMLEAGKAYPIIIESRHISWRSFHFQWAQLETTPGEFAKSAATADAIIAVMGNSPAVEGEELPVNLPGFKGGDRSSVDLPEDQLAFLKAARATGKPVIVVLINGGPVSAPSLAENANAVLEAWYPGAEGARAIGRALSGVLNPGGRMPVTAVRDAADLPPLADYAMANRTYRYQTKPALYPFGYGLSYTRFAYDKLAVSAQRLTAGQSLSVTGVVTNSGTRGGDEVVQLYLDYPSDLPGAPRRALIGFSRVTLAPGAKQEVRFTVDPRLLSSVNPAGERSVRTGAYRLSLGGGQPDTVAPTVSVPITIEGNYPLAP